MSEPTQPIKVTGEVPSVREVHASEQELIDLVLGTLAREEAGAVREHLDACGACRERFEALHLDDGSGATKVRDPLVGTMLGEYRVEAALARGGMGVVYRGVQPMIGKQVAIKVLIPELDDGESINRLLDEARAVNAIRHPNIIDIFSFGSLPGGRHYFVMELLDGKSIEDLINERRTLSPDEVMTILEQSCSALGAAHLAGVVHRDLKPANLFLSVLADGGWHVTVLDFGLAKRLGNTRKTATNVVMGTPGYMAPEQIRGKAVGAQTDLYALGVVAWVLLTGQEPFREEGIMDLLRAHIDAPLPSLAALAPHAPDGLVTLIESLLAKRPEDRPASALKVRESIQQVRAARGSPSTPLVRNPRKQGIPAGMPSSVLADGVADTAIRKTPAQPPPPARGDSTHVGPPPARVDTVVLAPLPAPHAVAPARRAGWVIGATVLLGLSGGALVLRAATTQEQPPVPTKVLPPVAADVVATPPPSKPLPEPPAPAPTVVEPIVEPAVEPTKPAPSVATVLKPVAVVKKAEPLVERRRRLASRLQQLERRFAQALARGESVDLELAEVRALRKGLDARADQQSTDAVETAVQRLEGTNP